MDDTDSEPTETEPLVRHDNTTTGVGGGTTPGGTTSKHQQPPQDGGGEGGGGEGTSRKGAPPSVPPRTPSRHHMDPKPRLSLVPEISEKSTEDDQEDHENENNNKNQKQKKNHHLESPRPLCPFFGVRNYLHQFYEKQDINDPALYEDLHPDEQIYLVKQTEGGCSSSVFRLSLILGGLLLLLGVVAFIVAACAARKTILVSQNGDVAVVDRVASAHNAQVDALLLVGLVAVTLGSTVVAAALISRAFCSRPEEYPALFPAGHYILDRPVSPMDMKVPVTEKLTQVQPSWGSAAFSIKGIVPWP